MCLGDVNHARVGHLVRRTTSLIHPRIVAVCSWAAIETWVALYNSAMETYKTKSWAQSLWIHGWSHSTDLPRYFISMWLVAFSLWEPNMLLRYHVCTDKFKNLWSCWVSCLFIWSKLVIHRSIFLSSDDTTWHFLPPFVAYDASVRSCTGVLQVVVDVYRRNLLGSCVADTCIVDP